MRPETPEGWQAVDAAYTAVKPFPPRDRVTATAWAIVAVLSALREKRKDTPEAGRRLIAPVTRLSPIFSNRSTPSDSRRHTKEDPGAAPTLRHLRRAA
jgi:hypothetical protein